MAKSKKKKKKKKKKKDSREPEEPTTRPPPIRKHPLLPIASHLEGAVLGIGCPLLGISVEARPPRPPRRLPPCYRPAWEDEGWGPLATTRPRPPLRFQRLSPPAFAPPCQSTNPTQFSIA